MDDREDKGNSRSSLQIRVTADYCKYSIGGEILEVRSRESLSKSARAAAATAGTAVVDKHDSRDT